MFLEVKRQFTCYGRPRQNPEILSRSGLARKPNHRNAQRSNLLYNCCEQSSFDWLRRPV